MRQKTSSVGLLASLGVLLSVASGGIAAKADDTLEQLKAQIRELDQKVRVLERKQEIDKEAAAEKSKTAPAISAGPSGFSLRSADTNFVLRLRGYIQADARWYPHDYSGGTANDTFLLRRVRPIIEGTVYDKYDFRVMLDFGGGLTATPANIGFLQDAYITARFRPEFQVQFGKFKEPVGLERLQSGSNLEFVERGYPTQLVPNRDVGIQVQGDLFENRASYAVGIFNGVADGGSGDFDTADDEKDLAARVFTTPFKNSSVEALKGVGFGLAGTYGNQEGALRTYVSAGQQKFFGYRTGSGVDAANANVVADGDHWRLSPQAYWYWGSFGLLGEYVFSNQRVRRDAGSPTFARLQQTAWQVAGSYILTGEEASWKGFTPRNPFSVAHHAWGAWEVVARYGQLDIDNRSFSSFANPATSASLATSWGIGLNWYLNKNLKFNVDFEQTDFSGGTSEFLTKGENVILSRAQVSF